MLGHLLKCHGFWLSRGLQIQFPQCPSPSWLGPSAPEASWKTNPLLPGAQPPSLWEADPSSQFLRLRPWEPWGDKPCLLHSCSSNIIFRHTCIHLHIEQYICVNMCIDDYKYTQSHITMSMDWPVPNLEVQASLAAADGLASNQNCKPTAINLPFGRHFSHLRGLRYWVCHITVLWTNC